MIKALVCDKAKGTGLATFSSVILRAFCAIFRRSALSREFRSQWILKVCVQNSEFQVVMVERREAFLA